MKYVVIAKFLGSYLPNIQTSIGSCVIKKSYRGYDIDDDRPILPVRSKDSEYHCLEGGVRNYIYYPQKIISSRTFESEYLISTEIKDSNNYYDILRKATDLFTDVSIALSLVAKNKTRSVGKKRIKKGDETYDFEIVGLFLKKNKELIRLKLPRPLVNGRNFFPEPFPKNFLSQAKKYLECKDYIFNKGLIYFQRSTTMRYSGVFNDLDVILNCVKCIELICIQVGKRENCFGLSKKQYEKLGTKEIINKAGNLLGVANENIKIAQEVWDLRNNNDVAHQSLHFNPYNRESTDVLCNLQRLEECVSVFLIKYYKYINI